MKQRITQSQWNELTPEQKAKFHELTKDKKYARIPHLRIGQMIEFLEDKTFIMHREPCYFLQIFWSNLRSEWVVRFENHSGEEIEEFNAWELCDALWYGTKEWLRLNTEGV